MVEAVLDQLLLGVVAEVPADAPWRDRLLAIATHYLAAVVSHPVVGASAGYRRTGGPGELALLEQVLSALTEAGLSLDQVARHYPLMAGYTRSMAASQAAHRLQDDRGTHASEGAWLSTHALVDAQRYPTAAALHGRVSRLRDAEVFLAGFELLLDAVAAAARA